MPDQPVPITRADLEAIYRSMLTKRDAEVYLYTMFTREGKPTAATNHIARAGAYDDAAWTISLYLNGKVIKEEPDARQD